MGSCSFSSSSGPSQNYLLFSVSIVYRGVSLLDLWVGTQIMIMDKLPGGTVLESWKSERGSGTLYKNMDLCVAKVWPNSGHGWENLILDFCLKFAWPLSHYSFTNSIFFLMSLIPRFSQFQNIFWKCEYHTFILISSDLKKTFQPNDTVQKCLYCQRIID